MLLLRGVSLFSVEIQQRECLSEGAALRKLKNTQRSAGASASLDSAPEIGSMFKNDCFLLFIC